MKKLVLFLLLCSMNSLQAQIPGTPYMVPTGAVPMLDQIGVTPSFAFSTRKLRAAYAGPAMKVRRQYDDSEATVAFDADGVVSGNSIVTLTAVGTSGAALGTTYTLSAYLAAIANAALYVTIWYDQGGSGYNGVQTIMGSQPPLKLASAGASNQYASLSFSGTSRNHVVVNQTLSTLLGGALRATIGMIAKPTTTPPPPSSNNSFGYFDPSDNSKRWSAHLNWPDGNFFTDFGYGADINRFVLNSSRLGVYKQYTMLRTNNTKTVKASGTFLLNAVAQNTTTALTTGGNFGVGTTTGGLSTQYGFWGNIPEFILFKEPLTTAQISTMESNQISFWGAN